MSKKKTKEKRKILWRKTEDIGEIYMKKIVFLRYFLDSCLCNRQWSFWLLRQVDIFKSSLDGLEMSEDYISLLILIIYNPIINYTE